MLTKDSVVNIDLNPQFIKALDIMENTDKNLFVTGKAGTGKSTLLDYFRNNTKKKVVILAPTGVAALNVRGETIHSFFRFKPDITVPKVNNIYGRKASIYKKIDTIIIDEVSMVRADLLDCVNKFLQLNGKDWTAFGGTQMIFIGDLYQLPPVVKDGEKEIFESYYESPYFFSAEVFKEFSMEFIELEKIYRQKDKKFIDILNSIRNNTITEDELFEINSRVGIDLDTNAKKDYIIYLTTTNKMALKVNEERLNQIEMPIHKYKAEIIGEFNVSSYPTDLELNICVGAQVMMLNNDLLKRWVNGTIGKVVDIKKTEIYDVITVQLSDESKVEVSPYTWEIFHYDYNESIDNICSNTVGTFTQYPLKLAWAITIHKSQGKTFNTVTIDMGRGAFAFGQTYVALSRCTSLEGISLVRPIRERDVFTDWRIEQFMQDIKNKTRGI